MAGWSSSTQRSRWMLTADELAARRRECNERAAAALRLATAAESSKRAAEAAGGTSLTALEGEPGGETLRGADTLAAGANVDGTGEAGRGGQEGGGEAGGRKGKGKGERGPEPLTLEEEREICRHFEWKLLEVCAAFPDIPSKVQSTAIQYLKRFFLKHSVMEHDPKNIMLTAIYVACKVDENYISAAQIGKGIQQDPQLLLNNELAVLQGVNFDLICYSPYRPLEGFFCDLDAQRQLLIQGESKASVEALRQAASAYIATILTTDVPLMFPPAQIALAALRLATKAARHSPQPPGAPMPADIDWDRYLEAVAKRGITANGSSSGQQQSHTAQQLDDCLRQIETMVAAQGSKPDEKRVILIDRKLKFCRNPALFHEELRKRRERKGERAAKQHKRTSHDHIVVPVGEDAATPTPPPLEEHEVRDAKRRRSAGQ